MYENKSYAVCKDHAADALAYMVSKTVQIINCSSSNLHTCHCLNQAYFYLREVNTDKPLTD